MIRRTFLHYSISVAPLSLFFSLSMASKPHRFYELLWRRRKKMNVSWRATDEVLSRPKSMMPDRLDPIPLNVSWRMQSWYRDWCWESLVLVFGYIPLFLKPHLICSQSHLLPKCRLFIFFKRVFVKVLLPGLNYIIT